MMQCAPVLTIESWVGDGYCDDGSWGWYFDCDEYSWDDGDCEAPATDDDGSTDADDGSSDDGSSDDGGASPVAGDSCDEGAGVIDCSLDCVSASTALSWTGDGYCDDVTEPYGFHLDCAAFEYDGGDCSEGGDGSDDGSDWPDGWGDWDGWLPF